MTTVIDHAIAIPTRPANVWVVLRDVANNPTWHPDCKRIQFLTTLRTGRGTRWRNTTLKNKEQVFEITAWYEGLGYEYRIVDGSKYPNNRGRIRLQEAPEGTILQWTFSYDVKGLFGRLRDSLSMRGHADRLIVMGLRNIYTVIKESKADEALSPTDSKAYLREAPNVEERASYQPRYPSKITEQDIATVQPDQLAPLSPPSSEPVAIQEPPLSDEDTRPNPVVAEATTQATPTDEPDFLKAMPAKAREETPPTRDNDVSEDSVEEETVGATEAVPDPGVTQAETPGTPEPAAETEAQELNLTDPSKMDTASVSVFEIFGLEKPSETERVRTLSDSQIDGEPAPVIESPIEKPSATFLDSTPIIPDVQPDAPERRQGLRAALRRRISRVRIPK